jgi:hypothetical protein
MILLQGHAVTLTLKVATQMFIVFQFLHKLWLYCLHLKCVDGL